MRIQLKCGSEERRQAIRDSNLNAIDYLEVLPRTETIPRPLLLLYCFTLDLDVEDREYGFCDKHFERHFHICTVHDLDKNGEEYTFQRKFPYVSTGGHSYYSKEVEDENKN